MLRPIILFLLVLFSGYSTANQQTLYQIDMILFTHQPSSLIQSEKTVTPLLAPESNQAIPLQISNSVTNSPYHTLPASSSQLSEEYRALSRKTDYQVLAHYSWLQPSNNQRAITLPAISRNGWSVEGTLRVRQSNYYLLDTDLFFSTPQSTQTAFIFSQKQRLKPGAIYYLDHPQAGMLVKIHKIA